MKKYMDLSLLTLDQQEAVFEHIREQRKINPPESAHMVSPTSVTRVFTGSKWKPWTWFSYKWIVNDPVIDNLYIRHETKN